MSKKRYVVALIMSAFSFSTMSQDLSFIEGKWRCEAEADIGQETTLKVVSIVTTSLESSVSSSQVTYTMYENTTPDKTSVLYIETSDNFVIDAGLVKSYNYKKHNSKLIKDDLNKFTPEIVEWFANDRGGETFVSKVTKIDNNNFIANAVPYDGTDIPCTRIK
ncbi:hypothetical protein L1286_00135 [Pseudoalteromonas sp. SMS1]|uniref:hypothetical protein n=1 Tax=Pseudoalteromonas sp. SMS1 TaxID=2908894 RepID=UPI001F24D32F|nr:hypothetical protein [Pseudoalteromonas sp. SMS1]MCF2855862.1 hypothetical protein [Pseudoalteromonas sp. SMS1]